MSTESITTKACEAWFVLEAADLRGLPQPFDVSVTDHTDGTRIGLKSPTDLRAWAEAIDADVKVSYHAGRTHLTAEGELHEMRVHVFHVMAAVVTTPRVTA